METYQTALAAAVAAAREAGELLRAEFHREGGPRGANGHAEEALVSTVGEGGDTDTNAAIAGALLGAALGREAIPFRWRQRVLTCRPLGRVCARPRPMEFWPVDALVVAEKLLLLGLGLPTQS